MKTGFIYDDIFLEHKTPPFHPESPERLRAILNAINSDLNLKESLIWINPKKATVEDIIKVHSKDYIEEVLSAKEGYLDSDTFLSKGSKEASLYAVGAVLTSIDYVKEGVIQSAFCAVRPPGHHAERAEAMGFCIFNNIAVGAEYAISQGFKKVFIIDFDVHHGNGIQNIFYDRSDVFYFSTHQYPHYPGTGRESDRGKGKGIGFTLNIPLSAYSGDEELIYIYKKRLPEVVKDFDPDIVLVSAGYDLRDKDPLSSINVTKNGIEEIIKGIISSKKGIPYIFALEGGYNLNSLSESVVITLKTLISH
ncbi:MAG: histone deacetylase [Proteobacteria bacterium]|nr:histone deacetylase [Pseudomonadota bacterium]